MSKYVHGQDFADFVTRTPDGEKAIKGLRDPSTIPTVAVFTCTFMIDACRLFINFFHPGELWGNWYERDVKERLHKLTDMMK